MDYHSNASTLLSIRAFSFKWANKHVHLNNQICVYADNQLYGWFGLLVSKVYLYEILLHFHSSYWANYLLVVISIILWWQIIYDFVFYRFWGLISWWNYLMCHENCTFHRFFIRVTAYELGYGFSLRVFLKLGVVWLFGLVIFFNVKDELFDWYWLFVNS